VRPAPWSLGFGDPAAADARLSGGKGASLARLYQAGFPVPGGVIVTAAADRVFRGDDRDLEVLLAGLDFLDPDALRRQCEEVRAHLSKRPLPPALEGELRALLPELLARAPVAVRSSSTLEDLAGSAFAGQHDTYLNLATIDSVRDGVRRCFLSLWEDRAVRYRHERGYGPAVAAMAVVIQSMVPSETSGVAFTLNPITGDTGELMINSAFGLGETVVSGEGDVDQYRLDRKTGRVIEARIADKRRAIVPSGDGTRSEDVAEERRRRPSLSAGELDQLRTLCEEVERFAGFPQDIEWGISDGKVRLLQSRPVTRFPERWTRDESAERFPNVVTPLTWDFTFPGFHASLAHSLRMMGLPPFDGRWFERFDGYVYGNQTAVRLFTAIAPAGFESVDGLRRSLAGLRARFPWVEELPVAWARDLDRYLLRLGALSSKRLDEATESELWAHVEAIDAAGRDYFLPNIAISLTHALLHRTLYRFLTLLAGADGAGLYDGLTGFCETKTSVVNADLHALARLARRDPALEDLLRRTDRRASWEQKRLASYPAFAAAFGKFLEDHGHREVDWDAFHPTWSGSPWVVLENVRLLLEQPSLVDPADRGVALREKQVRSELELARLAPEDLRFFAAELVRLCRAYTALDDVEHYQTTRLNVPFRAALMALGARLAARRALPAPEAVFFLRRQTVEELVAGRMEAADAMREAVEGAAKYDEQARANPPWIRGDGVRPAPEGALQGLPGSPGSAEGIVHRIFSAQDFPKFPPGAVLVARTTNPAWTPLFYGAAAVVTESGGPLSHGAVTAREVGIPAVMAVHGALEALPDGTRVRVNGTSGFVERL